MGADALAGVCVCVCVCVCACVTYFEETVEETLVPKQNLSCHLPYKLKLSVQTQNLAHPF